MGQKIAIIDKVKSNIDYSKYFEFDFELYHLCDSNVKRVLKKDITLIDFDTSEYDFIILVGADACKHIADIRSVVNFQGYLTNDKFLPLTNPSMLKFKPEGLAAFSKAIADINGYVHGTVSSNVKINKTLIDNEKDASIHINNIYNEVKNGSLKVIGVDSETTSLYPRDGYVLGICISTSETDGYYISSDILSDEYCEMLQYIFSNTKCVFHNAKFDLKFLQYHFGFCFPDWEDTMLLHYCLNEQTGTHGLKQLAVKYTDLGDYDKKLEEFKSNYCKKHKIKQADFSYEYIPFDILGEYGALDPVATLILFNMFYPKVMGSSKLSNVYTSLLKKGTSFLLKVEENGVPFNKNRLLKARDILKKRIETAEEALYSYKEIKEFETITGKILNVNSPNIVRSLLFDYLKLSGIGKRTATMALSTDAEVLEDLATQHPIPKMILDIKKAKKIKSTYIDKVLLSLDTDSRLRTGFNLTTTTSGRLSSSGKLNMQQLPRDDKTVKWCIAARPGFKIVSQDLQTAEVYIVAALSGDKALQNIFIEGGDYHSQMAKMKFNLPYTWQEIKEFHPELRQEAKSVSFEILYKLNMREEILQRFPKLKKWLLEQKKYIEENGFVYQFFGRKRRLPNVFSDNKEVKAHEVRSGVNALVQGPASDVNLLAGIEMQEYIEQNNMKTKIFGLVHDSILSEVPDDEVDIYCKKLAEITQKDRGLSIPGRPIGVDVEIGLDYSFKEGLYDEVA